ncbi:hypothetical protein HY839_01450 [Candidatus Azambacteria bacterium]|nr:hypothetical protein [Candidatus Azambacteria bacterium]
MEFLSFGTILKEQASLVLVGVYTDTITASLVKREEGKTVFISTATEPQEGEAFSNGVLDIERIALNCRKALSALPHTPGNAPHDVVFALGGGIGEFSFMREKGVREAKEKKITAEEVAALVGAHTQGNDKEVARSFAESFHIDGFAVADPIGLNGSEILIDIVRMACADGFAQSLSHVASSAGLSMKGFLDMRYAAAKHAKFFEEAQGSAIVLCIFEHETYAVLVRDRAVAGGGVARAGYGIMIEAIEKTFFVGREEAKGIMRAFTNKELDEHTSARIREACGVAGKALVADIAQTVSQLDPTSLLPGNIRVVSAGEMPQIDEAFRAPEWLASLPIERNATVQVWHAPEHDTGGTAFDVLIAESL